MGESSDPTDELIFFLEGLKNHQPEIVLTSTVSEKYFMMFSTCQILQQV